jgi:hypothetical protein
VENLPRVGSFVPARRRGQGPIGHRSHARDGLRGFRADAAPDSRDAKFRRKSWGQVWKSNFWLTRKVGARSGKATFG